MASMHVSTTPHISNYSASESEKKESDGESLRLDRESLDSTLLRVRTSLRVGRAAAPSADAGVSGGGQK